MQKEIGEWTRLVSEQHDFILTNATQRVASNLANLSPVNEGEYVADWDVAVGNYPADTEQAPDLKKNKTKRRLRQGVDNLKMGDVVFFENNDPVSIRLEYGYSKQAPQGVVRLTVRQWRKFVQGAARAAERKIRKQLGQ